MSTFLKIATQHKHTFACLACPVDGTSSSKEHSEGDWLAMENQLSVASSTVDSQVSEDWSTEEDEEDPYDDYYGEPNLENYICL